ncbi:MAG: methyltransferase domain-containing protein [Actinomycetota bacterium]
MTDPAGRWDERYGALEHAEPGRVAPFLEAVAAHLPGVGAALDVGGGLGANARWLAGRGLRTTLLDVSSVGLELARTHDSGAGLSYVVRDVERDGLPTGRAWDVILFHLFYDRWVVEAAAELLEPGGVLLVCQPTERNLERHPKPGRRFLLDLGEAASVAVATGLEQLEVSEGWRESGRHDAWLVLRRGASPRKRSRTSPR